MTKTGKTVQFLDSTHENNCLIPGKASHVYSEQKSAGWQLQTTHQFQPVLMPSAIVTSLDTAREILRSPLSFVLKLLVPRISM